MNHIFFVDILINFRRLTEYLEETGMLYLADVMASVDSPKGRVKKQSLYNRQPKA